jgi:hypothetical protein
LSTLTTPKLSDWPMPSGFAGQHHPAADMNIVAVAQLHRRQRLARIDLEQREIDTPR